MMYQVSHSYKSKGKIIFVDRSTLYNLSSGENVVNKETRSM